MEWWREARFGMFIHWGVYAVYGNIYSGIGIDGYWVNYDGRQSQAAEWIMQTAGIPRTIYRYAARQFDASEYNPRLWVEIAKNAGMRYIIITSKHHDGFCLFDTPTTDWDIADASGIRRDLLGELVDEAHAAGLKIGFYYSQYTDWMAEGGMGAIPELGHREYSDEQIENYVSQVAIPHIEELTARYDIDVFWFDSQSVNNPNKQAIGQRMLNALLNSRLGDKIIYNNRLGFDGLFETPESDTPDIPYNGYSDNRDWEACASLNATWGYEFPKESVWDWGHWKSGYYTISRLLELASKGGNFLLNVGPDCHGIIPDEAVQSLNEVGEWMKTHSETIYGTHKNNLLNPFEYGYVTMKTDNSGIIHWFLHISNAFLAERDIVLPGVGALPATAINLENNSPVTVSLEAKSLVNRNLIISLPDDYIAKAAATTGYTTIDLRFVSEPPQIEQSNIRNGKIRLTPYQAVTYTLKKDFQPYTFKFWYKSQCFILYQLFLEAGDYNVEAEYAAWNKGGEIYFELNGDKSTGVYRSTGNPIVNNDLQQFITDNLGGIRLNVPESKIYTLKISRNADDTEITNWINLRRFTLIRTDNGTDITTLSKTSLLSPNPVSNGYFFSPAKEGETVEIFDMAGKKALSVQSRSNGLIDVKTLKSGTYAVMGAEFKGKIIVEK
jgi:alpha-L-fucosidase